MNVEVESKWMTVEVLREGVGGHVYLPGDAGYDDARQAWNLAMTQEPQVIVDAETVVDVQLAVRFARSNGMSIGVMATGHGLPRACDGVLIRTARMRSVRIDPTTRMAYVQGGALVKDVLAAGQPHGLAMLSGSSPEVGVVGYTLGGGFGLMIRKHGLAIDKVRTVRIVTPDGNLVTASEDENAELFWAIRGGGGAFGVVVEMTMELVSQETVFGGATIYPADEAESILRAYAEWTASQPEEVTSTLIFMNLPPLPIIPEPLRGQAVVMLNACVCGGLGHAEEVVRPLRELGTPILDQLGAMPYAATECIYNDPTEPMPACVQGAMLGDLSPKTIERMIAALGPIDQMPQLCFQVRHVAGAMADVACDDTAVGGFRGASYMVYTIGVPNPFASLAALHDHADSLLTALGDAVVCRGPLNFLGEGKVRAKDVCGMYGEAEYARLSGLKRTIDPENAFCYAGVGLKD
ncbi:FAD-binding oxidoreductase [bacterium]|nr:MAG: FAD-binding oxidoreductase [bacterium]